MPTKPSDNPEQWATAGNYPASVYPAVFPWGDPHPNAGSPTPWSNNPRRTAAGLAGFANTGNVPLQAQAGDIWNEEFHRVVELTRWVFDGTSAADEDAHLVETDSAGQASLAQLQVGGNTAAAAGLRVVPTAGADASTISGGGQRAANLDNNSALACLRLNNVGAGLDLETVGPSSIGGVLTTAGGVNLGGQTIQGSAGSLVDVERSLVTDAEWNNAGTLLPASPRRVRWNDTSLTAHGSDGTIRSIAVPDRGFQATFSTPNAIDTTGAIARRQLQETEPCWIEVSFDFEHTTGAIGTLNTRIQVSGTPGTVDVNAKTYLLPASGGVRWRPISFRYLWTPTDDFVGPGTIGWAFTIRVGSSLGATLNTRDLAITAVSSVNV